MMNYKERVLFEFESNAINIGKLQNFLMKNTVADNDEFELLEKQINAMLAYNSVLRQRLMLYLNKKMYLEKYKNEK